MGDPARRRQWYAMRKRLQAAGIWKEKEHGKIQDDVQQDIRQYGHTSKKKRPHTDVTPEPGESDPEEGTSSVAGIYNINYACLSFQKTCLLC